MSALSNTWITLAESGYAEELRETLLGFGELLLLGLVVWGFCVFIRLFYTLVKRVIRYITKST